MSRCCISYELESNGSIKKNKIFGIKSKNSIVYIEDSIKTKIIFEKILRIERESDIYSIILYFNNNKKTNGIYILKQYDMALKIEIFTKEVNISNNSLYIEYELYLENEYNGLYKFKLNY